MYHAVVAAFVYVIQYFKISVWKEINYQYIIGTLIFVDFATSQCNLWLVNLDVRAKHLDMNDVIFPVFGVYLRFDFA